MLYHIYTYLDKLWGLPAAALWNSISFRAGMSLICALVFAIFVGKRIIGRLQKMQIGETIRDLGLEGQMQKKGTPTMGGIIILLSILLPVLCFAKLDNIYLIIMIGSTIWLGLIGFADDYIKVFRKNKDGLSGKFKLVGQIGLGLIVGSCLYLNDSVVVREKVTPVTEGAQVVTVHEEGRSRKIWTKEIKSTQTTIPFFKNNEFDYANLMPNFCNESTRKAGGWLIYVLAVIFIIAAVSNGANLTDGMDGLATGVSIVIGITLAIFAYLSGNIIYADYLNIMYIPNSGELVVYGAAFIGALIGFLWYNSYPAQVFMGDTGSLAIGGIIAVFAIMIRKELLIPILCGIFFVESLSVIIQVAWFKHTKRKTGVGQRIFKMTPLHHHFQKEGIVSIIAQPKQAMPESKIVIRFWIIAVILAVVTVVTLKIR